MPKKSIKKKEEKEEVVIPIKEEDWKNILESMKHPQFMSFMVNDALLSKWIFSKSRNERLLGEFWLNHIRIARLNDYICRRQANGQHVKDILDIQLRYMKEYENCLIIRAKQENINLHNNYMESLD